MTPHQYSTNLSSQAIPIIGKKIFITGGAGFIGSTLAGRLLDKNEVIIYDNLRRNSIKDRPYINHSNLSMINGDILDYKAMVDAMHGSHIIIHCAAVAGIDTVIQKPTETMRVNMVGTAKVLDAARTVPELERLVYFSTSEVFGQSAFRSEEGDTTHIGAVGEARWTYAVSKLAGEHLAKAFHQEYGMPTVTVRPFNIYGPGQVGEGALSTFIKLALRDEDIFVQGEGNQIRAWCYVDDFIEGLMLAMTMPNAIGESFNIGNARAVITVFGLAQTVVRVLNSTSKIRFVPHPGPDVELRIQSVNKAKELFGFESSVDLEEGILRTAEYLSSLPEHKDSMNAVKNVSELVAV
ncbi:MAG: NAD-dependent epimerase/dehydratase family protein [candidate division Zixibacteria bacterium]